MFDPALGEQTGRVALGGAAEVDAAVQAALRGPAGLGGDAAAAADAGDVQAEGAARARHRPRSRGLITAEHGKTLEDAKGSLTRGIEVVEFACGLPQLMKGEFSHQVGAGVDLLSVRHPVGVCAGITPFNFPAMVPLVDGPGRDRLRQRLHPEAVRARPVLPAGAGRADDRGRRARRGSSRVVNGGKEAVDAILAHPGIAAVSFVGSTPVAEYIYRTGTAAGKRVQALGGAKNHWW